MNVRLLFLVILCVVRGGFGEISQNGTTVSFGESLPAFSTSEQDYSSTRKIFTQSEERMGSSESFSIIEDEENYDKNKISATSTDSSDSRISSLSLSEEENTLKPTTNTTKKEKLYYFSEDNEIFEENNTTEETSSTSTESTQIKLRSSFDNDESRYEYVDSIDEEISTLPEQSSAYPQENEIYVYDQIDKRIIDDAVSSSSEPYIINVAEQLTCSEVPTVGLFNITPSSFNVTLNWEAPTNTNCTITEYFVQIDNHTSSTDELTITITNLTACTEYSVSIWASDGLQDGPLSKESFNTTTPENFNTYGVGSLNASKSHNNTLEVKWGPPPQEVLECVIDYYLIYWDQNDLTLSDDVHLDPSTLHYELPLIGCASYAIQVIPKAQDSDGQNTITYYEVEPMPTNPPTNVTNTFHYDKTELNVTWQTDNKSKNRCKLHGIVVTCEAFPDENSNYPWVHNHVEEVDPIDTPSPNFRYAMSIRNLSAFTNYSCECVVMNDGGNSSATPFSFQTLEDVPSAPHLTVVNIGPTNFALEWTKPDKIPGIMTLYGVSIVSNGPLQFPQKECSNNVTNRSFTIDSQKNSYNFEEAVAYHNYTVSIYGIDGAGNGESDLQIVNTASAEPDPIANPQIDPPIYSQNETYYGVVTVKFDPPCNTNGPLKFYEVSYRGVRTGFNDHSGVEEITETSLNIDLLPDRTYSIDITVLTESFRSEPVSVPELQSKSGVPIVKTMIPPSTNATNRAYFTLDKNYFDETNGEIISYSLFLFTAPTENGSYGFWDTWPEVPENGIQLTPNIWKPFTDGLNIFVIGGDSNCSESFCNKPLKEDTQYFLMMRALTSAAYRDSTLLPFKTAMLEGGLDLALILGLTFGLLALLVLIVFLVILWRRKRKNELPVEEKRYSTSTPVPIPVEKFPNYYASIKENYNIIKQQFTDLGINSKESAGEASFAVLPENRRKNRYTNILPYDSTRVTLNIEEDDEISSDYINASYIKGYSGKIEYIATQGPLESTARDFWKMILQENVSIITMVSQFIEQSKEKCYQYFPNNHESVYFGESLEVKCSTELHFGTYCIRTLQVRKGAEQRDVVHMQFLEWPDFGVPQGTDNMLQFCNQLREKVNKEGGLVVVHCSAGVGRTGTLIALDILLQTIQDHRDINIYKTVLDLRRQRTNMVQTEKQYIFIHTAIKDFLETPTIPSDDGIKERIYENVDILKSSLKKNLIESELESAL